MLILTGIYYFCFFTFKSVWFSINIASISANGVDLSPRPSVGLSVRKVYCGKMADWIWMSFGMVNGVG